MVGEEGGVDAGGAGEQIWVLRVGGFHAGVLVGEDGEGVRGVICGWDGVRMERREVGESGWRERGIFYLDGVGRQ